MTKADLKIEGVQAKMEAKDENDLLGEMHSRGII